MSAIEKIRIGLVILLISLVISACGLSPEKQAATAAVLTAAAATNTPMPSATPTPTSAPTPTSTPVPYDLSIIVTGEEDAPIVGATAYLSEVEGENNTQISDDVGQVFWYDLPGETVNLTISAQGYFSKDISESISRGVNQLTIKLDRDPHGILPSEACGPGEKLLYIEDFQDGKAQGWQEIEYRSPGWDLVPHPDSTGNKVASFLSETGTYTSLGDVTFDDAVWRIQIMPVGKNNEIFFNWHAVTEPYEVKDGTVDYSDYTVMFYEWGVKASRLELPLQNVDLLDIERYIKRDVWQVLEISTYFDTLEVWLDGTHLLKYNDPQPLPGGQIGLGVEASDFEGAMVYFDNLTVCELSEPFVLKPTSGP